MIRSIVAYGDPVLKKEAEVEEENQDLASLIEDMWETMYAADGVGSGSASSWVVVEGCLADGSPFGEGEDGDPGAEASNA